MVLVNLWQCRGARCDKIWGKLEAGGTTREGRTVSATVGNGAGESVAKSSMEFDMRQNLGEVGSGLDDNLGGSLKRVGEYILFLCFILLYSSFSNASILCSFCKCLCRTIAPKQTSVTAETEKHFNMAHTPRHCNRGRSLYGENDGDVEVKEGGHSASTIKETTRRGS